ncbi:hypothetical protein CW304_06880 [Bacillus sp. UFRGS-B20]|nr:hypothetical protein CW304_06880 [Bacillus sp. UFRGS-B20]
MYNGTRRFSTTDFFLVLYNSLCSSIQSSCNTFSRHSNESPVSAQSVLRRLTSQHKISCKTVMALLPIIEFTLKIALATILIENPLFLNNLHHTNISTLSLPFHSLYEIACTIEGAG